MSPSAPNRVATIAAWVSAVCHWAVTFLSNLCQERAVYLKLLQRQRKRGAVASTESVVQRMKAALSKVHTT